MKIVVTGNAKEIAALVLAAQERRSITSFKILNPEEFESFINSAKRNNLPRADSDRNSEDIVKKND